MAALRKYKLIQAEIPKATEEECAKVEVPNPSVGKDWKVMARLMPKKVENVSWGQLSTVLSEVLGGKRRGGGGG